MTDNNINNLLQQVIAINKKYEGIADITGENFNVFRILKVEASEVRTHSAFLAELLNPKGSHGQKDVFLKAFIKYFNIEGFSESERIDAKVIVEENIGNKNEDGTEGGRIDIVIKPSKGKTIVIENKIHAGDQENQLLRYKNYYPDAHLLYLTLYGNEPSNHSKRELLLDKDFKIISYFKNILEWIEICRKETATHPILRETLTQYINLIKYLTDQTIIEEMEEEMIKKITESGANIQSAIQISANLQFAKELLLKTFAEKIKNVVVEKIKNIDIRIDENFGRAGNYIDFRFHSFPKNFFGLAFLNDYGFATIQIKDEVDSMDKINFMGEKKQQIRSFLHNELEIYDKNWTGKLENAVGWHSEWVKRYKKLDHFLNGLDGWIAMANKDYSFANEVAEDILAILTVFEKRLNKFN